MVARASLGSWWWPYEGEVNGDLLLEELLTVGALDGCLCFIQRSVLNEDVALRNVSLMFSIQISNAYLDVTCPPIQVHVQILNSAKLSKHVVQILLCRLFVYVGDNDDPSFNGAHSCCAGLGARVAGLGVGLGLVNVHFHIGHGCSC